VAVFAIGDLQGCHDEFRRLLDTLRFDPAHDRLWLTGDIVNRGPGSLPALRLARSLDAALVTVLGNHDLHLLAVARGAPMRRGDTLDAILAAADRDELLEWLATRPLMHVDPVLRTALVHAGIPPQWDVAQALERAREVEAMLQAEPDRFFAAMYGDGPERWSDDLSAEARWRYTVNCLTRLRFCTRDGRLLLQIKGPPASAPPDALPWFRVPGRRSAHERIVCGHWSALGFHQEDQVLALDSGCVWGGALTAVRLDAAAAPVSLRCRGAAAVRPE
jgi:bis(5'-nucleosyl)-tetraphosphatase (symmetrical)